MDADFNQKLQRVRGGTVEVMKFWNNEIGDEGARALSMALMHKNHKVTTLNLYHNKIGED